MRITCRQCHKSYELPDSVIKRRGVRAVIPCPACKNGIEVFFPEETPTPRRSGQVARQQEARNVEPTPRVPETTPAPISLKSQVLASVKDLPPMPQVAYKAREILADDDSSFSDLARVIEADQAIAARVLKIANSPYYGSGGKITSLQQGAVFLGMKTLEELLTLACASSVLSSDLDGYGLEAGALWQHSLAAAACARGIAKRVDPKLKNDAFSAGLIHDCGKLVLAKYIGERSGKFEQFLAEGNRSFLEAERHILGFSHAEIGSEICEMWNIPENLSAPTRLHHNPSDAVGNTLVAIVHAADVIAQMSGIGAGTDGMMYAVDDAVVELLDLDEVTIAELMAMSVEYVEKTTKGF